MLQPEGGGIWERGNGRRRAEEGHARLKVKTVFFNADEVLLASTNPGWTQSMFDILTGIFGRVGLWKNIRNTVGMICQTCRASGVRAEEACDRGGT